MGDEVKSYLKNISKSKPSVDVDRGIVLGIMALLMDTSGVNWIGAVHTISRRSAAYLDCWVNMSSIPCVTRTRVEESTDAITTN